MAVTINTSSSDRVAFKVDKKLLRDLHRNLRKVRRNAGLKFMRDALVVATRPMVVSAKQKAPKRQGGRELGGLRKYSGRSSGGWRMIQNRRMRNPAQGAVRVGIGVHRDGFWMRFQETGYFAVGRRSRTYKTRKGLLRTTRSPLRRRDGSRIYSKGTTWVPPQPFLRPAFHEKKDLTIRLYSKEAWRRLSKGLPKRRFL